MNTRTTYQRFQATNARIHEAHLQNNGKRLALLRYALVRIVDEEMEESTKMADPVARLFHDLAQAFGKQPA